MLDTTHDPLGRSAVPPRPRKSSEGFETSWSPRSFMRKTQISSALPKRFLCARTMRYSAPLSPSK